MTGLDPAVTDYVLKEPAKCPKCRGDGEDFDRVRSGTGLVCTKREKLIELAQVQKTKAVSFPMRQTMLILFASVILTLGIASGQTQTGTIAGTIRDAGNALIPGVQVTLMVDKKESGKAVTDRSAEFAFSGAPVGWYEVKAELPGFETLIVPVRLSENETRHLNLVLHVKPATSRTPQQP